MIVAGQIKDLSLNIHNQSDSSMTGAGTIKLVVRLESDDAEDGWFWNHTTVAWVAGLPALGDLPPLTHIEAALWNYSLPAAASTGKIGDSIHFTATDNLTEASATIVSESGEHIVLEGLPSTQTSVDLLLYLGEVWIDTANGTAGAVVGVNGIATNPTDNLADAITLAAATGLRSFAIRKTSGGPLTLTSSLDDWSVRGVGDDVVIAIAGQDVDGTVFTHINLSGANNGRIQAIDCELDGVSELEGHFEGCHLKGGCVMPAAGGAVASFYDCSSAEPGAGASPNFDVSGAAANTFEFRGYTGGLEIEGSDHADTVGSIDLVAGQVIFAATNTLGACAVRGITDYTDNSGAGFVVTKTAAINHQEIRDAMKLAPSAGSPAVASVDEHLDAILVLADEIHKRLGLNAVDDQVITPTTMVIGGISMTITKVGSTITVSRA